MYTRRQTQTHGTDNLNTALTVSYTHLDVYKRQLYNRLSLQNSPYFVGKSVNLFEIKRRNLINFMKQLRWTYNRITIQLKINNWINFSSLCNRLAWFTMWQSAVKRHLRNISENHQLCLFTRQTTKQKMSCIIKHFNQRNGDVCLLFTSYTLLPLSRCTAKWTTVGCLSWMANEKIRQIASLLLT